MNRRIALLAGSAAILTMSMGATFGAANVPAYVGTAIADMNRPAAQTELDKSRKPAEMMAFAMVKPGDKVVEIWPGGGYVTRLLSKIVGPAGKVYGLNAPGWPDRLKGAVKAVTDSPAYSNVTVLGLGSEPVTTAPLSISMRANPLMPHPPMPMKCTRLPVNRLVDDCAGRDYFAGSCPAHR